MLPPSGVALRGPDLDISVLCPLLFVPSFKPKHILFESDCNLIMAAKDKGIIAAFNGRLTFTVVVLMLSQVNFGLGKSFNDLRPRRTG